MKNNSKQSSLRIRNKVLAGIVSALLLIVIAGGVVLGVGFGKYGMDTAKWFKPNEQEEVQDPEGDGSSLVVSVQNTQEISLLMSSATVASDGSTTQDITATLNASATIQRVNWSVAFKNSASEWATGKNVSDYVTIARTGDLSATITCHQAFGEQIIITATAADNAGAKATATCDYIKRVKALEYDVNGALFEDIGVHESAELYIECSSTSDDRTNILVSNITYSDGTLTPEIVFDYDLCTLSGSGDNYDIWKNFEYYLSNSGFSFSDENYQKPFESRYFDFEKLLTTGIVDTWSFILPEIRNALENDPDSDTAHDMQDFDTYIIKPALYNFTNLHLEEHALSFEIVFDVVYNGTIIQEEMYTYIEPAGFSTCSHFVTVASSVQMSNPSIIF